MLSDTEKIIVKQARKNKILCSLGYDENEYQINDFKLIETLLEHESFKEYLIALFRQFSEILTAQPERDCIQNLLKIDVSTIPYYAHENPQLKTIYYQIIMLQRYHPTMYVIPYSENSYSRQTTMTFMTHTICGNNQIRPDEMILIDNEIKLEDAILVV